MDFLDVYTGTGIDSLTFVAIEGLNAVASLILVRLEKESSSVVNGAAEMSVSIPL